MSVLWLNYFIIFIFLFFVYKWNIPSFHFYFYKLCLMQTQANCDTCFYCFKIMLCSSWGKSWGDGGYFKIRRGTNECGFEERVVATLANSGLVLFLFLLYCNQHASVVFTHLVRFLLYLCSFVPNSILLNIIFETTYSLLCCPLRTFN